MRCCASLPLNAVGVSHEFLDIQGQELVDIGWIGPTNRATERTTIRLRNMGKKLGILQCRWNLPTDVQIAKHQAPHVVEIEKLHGVLRWTHRYLELP